MTIYLTPYLSLHGPKYLAITRALCEAIRQGERVPPTACPAMSSARASSLPLWLPLPQAWHAEEL